MMGLQLETQWKKAVRGEAEQHVFGAMMIALQARLSTLGQPGKGGHDLKKGQGVEGWLQTHAPEVRRPTALRWMKATQGLLLAAKITDAEMVQRLLGSPAEELPEPERVRQLELFETLEKHSQADLIARVPAKRRGGNHHPKCPQCGGDLRSRDQEICPHCKKPTGNLPEPGADPKLQEAIDLWTPLIFGLKLEGLDQRSFVHLPDHGPVSRATLKGLITDVNKALLAAEREAR